MPSWKLKLPNVYDPNEGDQWTIRIEPELNAIKLEDHSLAIIRTNLIKNQRHQELTIILEDNHGAKSKYNMHIFFS